MKKASSSPGGRGAPYFPSGARVRAPVKAETAEFQHGEEGEVKAKTEQERDSKTSRTAGVSNLRTKEQRRPRRPKGRTLEDQKSEQGPGRRRQELTVGARQTAVEPAAVVGRGRPSSGAATDPAGPVKEKTRCGARCRVPKGEEDSCQERGGSRVATAARGLRAKRKSGRFKMCLFKIVVVACAEKRKS